MNAAIDAAPGEQLNFVLRQPRTLGVDGMVVGHRNYNFGYRDGEDARIRYIGAATQQFDGTWRALADVNGLLCLVEVKIKEFV